MRFIAKENTTSERQIPRIREIVDGDISAEAVSTASEQMLVEGRRLTSEYAVSTR